MFNGLNVRIKLIDKKMRNFGEKRTVLLLFVLLILMSITAYGKFIFGSYLYIYGLDDIACDSIKQTIPMLLHNSTYIAEFGTIPKWSFSTYLGTGTYTLITDIINVILTYLDGDLLVYLLVYVQCIKIVISGLFFYGYLRELGRSKYSSVIFAIAYAFCGHIIARGGWQAYPTEVMCAAILLFFEEKSIKSKKYYYISFALAFLTINLKLYYFVLYSGLVTGYYFFRKFVDGAGIRSVVVETFHVIASILAGGALAGFILVPEIVMQSQGARIQEGISHFYTIFDFPLNHLLNYNVAWESLLRSFSWDMLPLIENEGNIVGTTILATPLFYIGIFPLVLILEGFFVLEKRLKIWFFCSMILCISMVIFAYPRYLLTGLQLEAYYKLGYFWVVILLLFWCSAILDSVIEKRIIKILPLISVSFIYIGIIVFTMTLRLNKFNNISALKSIVFIILYVVLLYKLVYPGKNDRIYKNCILSLVIIEAVLSTVYVWYGRDIVAKEQWGSYVYTEDMQNVIDFIKENNNEFYRIDRQEVFDSLCDSLVYNYYGTQSYLGGNSHSIYVGDFMESINAPFAERGKPFAGKNNFSFIYGFKNVNNIDTLLGVKYYISNGYKTNKFGYDAYYTYDNYYVFSNKYSLPLAFVYDNYIVRDDYNELDISERRDVLLKYCVVENIIQNQNIERVTEIKPSLNNDAYYINCDFDIYFENEIVDNNNRFDIFTENSNILEVVCHKSNDNVMPVISFNCTVLNDTYARLFIYDEDGNKDYNSSVPIFLAYGENNFKFEIPYRNVPRIEIELLPGISYQFSDFAVKYVDDRYFDNYIEDINNRKDPAFYLENFKNDFIEGNISLDEDKILFFSIPYDKGWSAYVDGEEADLELCNIGFMSLFLTEGRHNIVLKYVPQGLEKGMLLTVCGLFICIVWIIITNGKVLRLLESLKKRGGKTE